MCYFNSRQLGLLQITTPGVLLQFTIAWLSEFSTTVTKIYDRRAVLKVFARFFSIELEGAIYW